MIFTFCRRGRGAQLTQLRDLLWSTTMDSQPGFTQQVLQSNPSLFNHVVKRPSSFFKNQIFLVWPSKEKFKVQRYLNCQGFKARNQVKKESKRICLMVVGDWNWHYFQFFTNLLRIMMSKEIAEIQKPERFA